MNLEKQLDEVFSQFIRLRDSDCNGYIRCYCCGYAVHWTNAHNGHFINRRHLGTRWHEINNNACCTPCNIYKNGNLDAYRERLVSKWSESIIDQLTMLKTSVIKFTDTELKDMIKHYKNEVKKLRKEKGL